MQNDTFVWTDELVAEYSLASQKLTLYEFKRQHTFIEVKKDNECEILSFIDTNQNLIEKDIKSNCYYRDSFFVAFNTLISNPAFKIHSVKRLS